MGAKKGTAAIHFEQARMKDYGLLIVAKVKALQIHP